MRLRTRMCMSLDGYVTIRAGPSSSSMTSAAERQ